MSLNNPHAEPLPASPPDIRWELQEAPCETDGEAGESHPAIGILTLDRPDKRNALTPTMLASIPAAIDELVAGGARVIVITGEGKLFCAGFDLSLCKDDQPNAATAHGDGREPVLASLLRLLSQATRAMRACPVPLIVAAHGGAVAGACAMLCAADIAVTDAQAKIGYPVVPLGISPAVSAPHLAGQVGQGHARARLLDPALITGAQAHRLGLVHEIVEKREGVFPRAIDIAQKLAQKPPHAIRVTKALLNTLDGSADAGTDMSNIHDAALRASLDIVGGEEQQRLLAKVWT